MIADHCHVLIQPPDPSVRVPAAHLCCADRDHQGDHECRCGHTWQRCRPGGNAFWCASHESRWSAGVPGRPCDAMGGDTL